jgi:hypothetical protein
MPSSTHRLVAVHRSRSQSECVAIPFPHRDLATAHLTSLSLLSWETIVENVVLYNLSSKSYLNNATDV